MFSRLQGQLERLGRGRGHRGHGLFLSGISETPKDFPATVMWEFRVAAIGIQAVLWTGFGLIFGHLAERVLEPKPAVETSTGIDGQAAAVAH